MSKVQVPDYYLKYDGIGNEKEETDSQGRRNRTWLAGYRKNIQRKKSKTTQKF